MNLTSTYYDLLPAPVVPPFFHIPDRSPRRPYIDGLPDPIVMYLSPEEGMREFDLEVTRRELERVIPMVAEYVPPEERFDFYSVNREMVAIGAC